MPWTCWFRLSFSFLLSLWVSLSFVCLAAGPKGFSEELKLPVTVSDFASYPAGFSPVFTDKIWAVWSGARVLGWDCPEPALDIRHASVAVSSVWCRDEQPFFLGPCSGCIALAHLLSTRRPAPKCECTRCVVASYCFSFTSVVSSVTSKCKSFNFILKGFYVRT